MELFFCRMLTEKAQGRIAIFTSCLGTIWRAPWRPYCQPIFFENRFPAHNPYQFILQKLCLHVPAATFGIVQETVGEAFWPALSRALRKQRIADHLVWLLASLYARQSGQVTGGDTGDSEEFEILVGFRQGCVLSPRVLRSWGQRDEELNTKI